MALAACHRETFKAEATHKRAAEEAAAEAAPEDMETEAGPAGKRAKVDAIPADVIDDITAVNVSLSKARKKRAISETLASVEELASFSLLGNTPLHKVRGGGITALALNPDNVSWRWKGVWLLAASAVGCLPVVCCMVSLWQMWHVAHVKFCRLGRMCAL